MEYLLLLVGFILLIKGADFFVEGDALRIVLTQPTSEDSARYQQVIENHLQRFARDETLVFDWQPV